MTKTVEIEYLIEVLGYIGDELSNIADKPTVEINKEGVTPSEVATTLTQGDTTYSVGGGGVTRDLIGDFDINTSQSGNLTTTKDMSQYDILEIEWIEKGNRWMGGYWANEHIMFARYKTSDPKDPNDTSGLMYSSSTGSSMAYTGDMGMAVRFVDTTTLVNMQFSNMFISKIWGIKY